MVCQAKSGDTSCEQASAVLMARIVDRTGAEIRPSHVSSIEYSLYEIDPFWPEHLTVVCGHRDVPLCVTEVLSDALQTGSRWSVDDVGFNFQHEITFVGRAKSHDASTRCELRYEFAMTGGEEAIVRFQLRSGRQQ
jgi:hypothetical protein